MRSRHPLSQPFAKRLRALASQADAALTGDTLAIHQARVASRRLREILPLVQTALDDDEVEELQRRMRRVTRLLGPVRELDVTLELAVQHRESRPAEAPALTLVAARLTHEREARYARIVRDLRPDKLRKWLDRAADIHKQLDEVKEGRAWRKELAERLRKRAQRLLAATEDAGLLFTSDRLHEVRIAVKRLRYVLELAGELQVARPSPGRIGARVNELKAAQDILGHLHDLDVLVLQVQASASDRPANRAARQALDVVSLRLDNERRAAHAEYLSHRLRLVQLADWVADDLVPRALAGADGVRKRSAEKTAEKPVADKAGPDGAGAPAATRRRARGVAESSASPASVARRTPRTAAPSAPRSARPRPS